MVEWQMANGARLMQLKNINEKLKIEEKWKVKRKCP
jgi:hypothetical protein